MMNLERLKAVRSANWGVVTNLAHEVDEIIGDTVAEEKVGHLKVIVEQLRTKLSVLQKFDDDILGVCDVKDIEHEIEESEEISAKIFKYQRKIEAILKPTAPLGQLRPLLLLQQLSELVFLNRSFEGMLLTGYPSGIHIRQLCMKTQIFRLLLNSVI